MPKKVVTLNDFAGGLNSVTAPRDLSGKQLSVCKNFDPSSPGQLVPTTIGGLALHTLTNRPTNAPSAGGDAFVFSADYRMDQLSNAAATGTNAAPLSSEFICTRDDDEFDALELNTTANTCRQDIFAVDVGAPVDFYSAEGDLFASSVDPSKVPMSLQFIDRTHVNDDSIKKWKQLPQDKVAPVHETVSNIGMDLYDETIKDRGDDFVHWGIKFNDTADTGTWNNDLDGIYHVFGSSFVHKNGAESAIVEIGDSSEDAGAGTSAGTGAATNSFTDETNKSVKVAMWITSSAGSYRDHIYGTKLYIKESTTNTWYLLAEVDFNKGIKGDGEDGFSAFTSGSATVGPFTNENSSGHTAVTGYITSPPVLITYELANGFCTSDLPTNRQVNWKCSVVANSRAYVGNVELKDIGTFGDRLLKSPVFQYDTFTADSYIDVAPNDGDQIIALQAYADRILMFKEKVLYILNASKELEFLESEHRYAGVKIQGAITKTPFGVAWVNNNGCYFYDGESVNLLQLGKIKDAGTGSWSANITDNAIIGYDELSQQLVVIWDSSSSGTGNGYIYSFSSGCWHELTEAFVGADSGQGQHMTNFVNLNDQNLVYIGGTTVGIVFKWDAAIAPVLSGNVTTADIHFGNYESKKNICGLTISYKTGTTLTVKGRGNLGTFSLIGTLGTVSDTFTVERYDLTSTAAFQGINTFQIELTGSVDDQLEIEDISITYRDLGVH